jgi:hypothetical protein
MEKEDLTVNEMALRARSKKEMYQFLQVEGEIYLPPSSQVNWDYVADILSGEKNVRECLIIAI